MSKVTFDFNGKRALVTGAGRGIGRAVAKALAASGAETFALSKTLENLESLVSEDHSIHPVCVDLSDWEATRKAVEELGRIDLLVNNAGILIANPFLTILESDIDSLFAINLKAVVNVSQVVAKKMIESGSPGSIVNISSISSTRVAFNRGAYCSSKGALDQITRNMALELGKDKIRVNSVNPGYVYTDMAIPSLSNEELTRKVKERVPSGQFSETSDIVGPVLFLLSDSASMINGVSLLVDGGMLLLE